MPAPTNIRQLIGPVVQDLVSNFMFYNRREDDTLPTGAIEEAVCSGEITVDQIVEVFRNEVSSRCQSYREAHGVTEAPSTPGHRCASATDIAAAAFQACSGNLDEATAYLRNQVHPEPPRTSNRVADLRERLARFSRQRG